MASIALYRNGFPNYQEGDEKRVFGKDAEKVMQICRILMDRYMYNTGHPRHPGLEWIKKMHYEAGMTFRDARDIWQHENIEKYTEYLDAVKIWKNDGEKLLRKLYGIAKRHHVHVKWLINGAVCYPDQFMVSKNGDRFALIQM